jgi:hypothetical protein
VACRATQWKSENEIEKATNTWFFFLLFYFWLISFIFIGKIMEYGGEVVDLLDCM